MALYFMMDSCRRHVPSPMDPFRLVNQHLSQHFLPPQKKSLSQKKSQLWVVLMVFFFFIHGLFFAASLRSSSIRRRFPRVWSSNQVCSTTALETFSSGTLRLSGIGWHEYTIDGWYPRDSREDQAICIVFIDVFLLCTHISCFLCIIGTYIVMYSVNQFFYA